MTDTFIDSSPLAVVAELQLDAEVLLAEQRHGRLQLVFRRRRDAHLISLDRRLDFLQLRVLDGRRDLLGGVRVERGLELDLAANGVAAGRLHLTDVEILYRDGSFNELGLND